MFKLYTPDERISHVFYIKDTETGVDWYEYQKEIDNSSTKIAVDENDFIRFAFVDPYSIFPKDCNVFVVDELPSDFEESTYGWFYIDGKFIHITDTEQYKNKVQLKETNKIKDAYRELRLQSDLGIISNDDLKELNRLHTVLVEKYKESK